MKQLTAVFLLLFIWGCATFDGNITVEPDISDSYISPGVADGVQDELIVSGDVPEVPGLRLAGYRFQITALDGQLVWELSESVETGFFGRLFGLGAGQQLPEKLVWAGVDSTGALVAEGVYEWSLHVWDRRDNSGVVGPYTVTVDNTPPSATPEAESLWFSPDGDGRRDTLVIANREISREQMWAMEIVRDGLTVATFSVAGAPDTFAWDGRTADGTLAEDGTYRYVLSSRDLAGNAFRTELEGLFLDTSPSQVRVDRQLASFSPNNDGRLDQQLFSLEQRASTPVSSYELAIVNDRGTVFRQFTGAAAVPAQITFNGQGDNGRVVPDGRYFARLEVFYQNGALGTAVTDAFVVDTRAPSVAVNAGFLLFSPDGDGRKDTIPVQTSSSTEALWESEIRSAGGQVVRRYSWTGRVGDFTWDGTDANGDLVPDGTYSYEITSTDEAGNTTTRRFAGIRVDTRPTPVQVATEYYGLSPNGDGIRDTVDIRLAADIRDDLAGWTIDFLDEEGSVVRQFADTSGAPLPDAVIWDGRAADEKVLEGTFLVRAIVEYQKGNISTAELPRRLIVDVSGPVIQVSYDGLPFSPDGDGTNDILRLSPSVADASPISGWTVQILDPAGNEFVSFRGTGTPRPFNWNGRSASGELIQSADVYTVRFGATDLVGNASVDQSTFPTDILVIRDGDRLRINIASIYFKPFTADFMDVEDVVRARNLETLDRLAEILARFPDYQIRLEGHAVRLLWDRASAWPGEETNTLAPLSLARAAAIRTALIERGITAARMTTAGLGGTRPIVPHGDTENRWKNRRVEFILVR